MGSGLVSLEHLVIRLCSISILLSFIIPTIAIAATEGQETVSENALVVKRAKGLRFTVPADWPVLEKDGITGPIPVEEYLAMKFSKVASRVQGLQNQIQILEKELEAIRGELKVVQEELHAHPEADETLGEPEIP